MTSKDKYEPSEWTPNASSVAEKGFLDDNEVVGKLKLSHTQPSDASNKAAPFVDLSAREMIEELRHEVRGGREESRQEMLQFRQEQEQRLQDIRQQQDQMMRQMEVIAQLVSANRETGRPQESNESETLPDDDVQITIWTSRNAVPRTQDNVGPDSPLHLTTPTSPTITESGSRRSVSQRQGGRQRQRPSPCQNKMKNGVLNEEEVSDLVNSRALTGVDMDEERLRQLEVEPPIPADEERLRQLEVEPLFTADENLLLSRAYEKAEEDEANEEQPAISNREVHVRVDNRNQRSDLLHRERDRANEEPPKISNRLVHAREDNHDQSSEKSSNVLNRGINEAEREDGHDDPCSDEVISAEQENENDYSRSDEVVQKRRHSQ